MFFGNTVANNDSCLVKSYFKSTSLLLELVMEKKLFHLDTINYYSTGISYKQNKSSVLEAEVPTTNATTKSTK